MRYVDVQKIVEPAFPPGRLNYWKANFVEDLSEELIDGLIDSFGSVPSPYSMIVLEQMGGAVTCVPDSATAFELREAKFSLLILSGCEHVEKRCWRAVHPMTLAGISEGVWEVDTVGEVMCKQVLAPYRSISRMCALMAGDR